jgi:hypothetical protein
MRTVAVHPRVAAVPVKALEILDDSPTRHHTGDLRSDRIGRTDGASVCEEWAFARWEINGTIPPVATTAGGFRLAESERVDPRGRIAGVRPTIPRTR